MANISYQKRTARGNYDTYMRSSMCSIFDAYGKPSAAKVNAWNYCQALCDECGGYGLRVINYNTFTFTAGFETIDIDTGVVQFTYITPNYDITVDAPCIA